MGTKISMPEYDLPLPPNTIRQNSVRAHDLPVLSCSISLDKSFIVTSSIDKTLKVWDTYSMKLLLTLEGHDDAVTSCIISYDNTKIISTSLDKTIKIWYKSLGTLVATLHGHSQGVTCSDISFDGHIIVSSSNDKTLKMWDSNRGSVLKTFVGHTKEVTCCSILANGSKAVSGSADKTLRIWNLQDGSVIHILNAHSMEVTCCAVSFCGSIISSSSSDGTVIIWETLTGAQRITLKGEKKVVSSCKISADGGLVVSSLGNSVCLWNSLSKKGNHVINTIDVNSKVHCCAMSNDVSVIISAAEDGQVSVWPIKINIATWINSLGLSSNISTKFSKHYDTLQDLLDHPPSENDILNTISVTKLQHVRCINQAISWFIQRRSQVPSQIQSKMPLAPTITNSKPKVCPFSDEFLNNPKWECHGGETTPYKSICLLNGPEIYDTNEYEKLKLILKKCGAADLNINKVYVLNNEAREDAFSVYNTSLMERFRSDPKLFRKDDWRSDGQRHWIFDKFQEFSQRFEEWNSTPHIPIIPCFQGTSEETMWKIGRTGFTTVSSLDPGWYGGGIYFTTQPRYAMYYSKLSQKNTRCAYSYLILAFVSPGNLYPVKEDPRHSNSLEGKPAVPGYQSHYVLVHGPNGSYTGFPANEGSDNIVDELVVFQDAQALPVYLLVVEN